VTTSDAVANEDWLRARTWDLPTELEPFLRSVFPNAGESKVDAVRRFVTSLPAAAAMPRPLRAAVDGWLRDQAK
jgi:hypothetical protein